MNVERKEAINMLFLVIQDKGTAAPIICHACQIIAQELCCNPQLKFKELIISKVESLLRTHEKKSKKVLVELISSIFINEEIYHQKNFVKTCNEFIISLFEDLGNQPVFQLKILSTAITNMLRFIVSNQFMLESLHNSLNFIKNKCIN